MKKIIMLVLALSFSTCLQAADYVAEREKAVKLMYSGGQSEALTIFTNLAAGASSDFQKSDALELAANCANALRKHDLALELAGQIPMPGVSKQCRMNILLNAGKYADLIAAFKAEDIESWPAGESVIARGLYCRGSAYARLKDGAAAEADLKKAAGYHTGDIIIAGGILFALGNNYRDNLKDNARALEAYKMIIDNMKSFYAYNFVLLQAAVILRGQGKHDEALKLLASADLSRSNPNTLVNFLGEWGETLAGQGKKTEAAAKYNEALAVKEIPADRRELYGKKIRELQDNPK
ncbi:MAG: hypothetical protein WC299_08820 [Kiritimatiellia bacterium]